MKDAQLTSNLRRCCDATHWATLAGAELCSDSSRNPVTPEKSVCLQELVNDSNDYKVIVFLMVIAWKRGFCTWQKKNTQGLSVIS